MSKVAYRRKIRLPNLIPNSDTSHGWAATALPNTTANVPYGWAYKGGAVLSSTHGTFASTYNGTPCIHMKSDTGTSVYIRPISNGANLYQNHPSGLLPSFAIGNPYLNYASNTLTLVTGSTYLLHVTIYEITSGALKFERNGGPEPNIVWTTAGDKEFRFTCGVDINTTFIRNSGVTDLKFGNVRLYYVGPAE